MKLICTAQPRLDGTVVYEFGGKAYPFARDAQGDLAGEVAERDAALWAIQTGNFYPADEADEQDALDGVAEQAKPKAKRGRKAKAADDGAQALDGVAEQALEPEQVG